MRQPPYISGQRLHLLLFVTAAGFNPAAFSPPPPASYLRPCEQDVLKLDVPVHSAVGVEVVELHAIDTTLSGWHAAITTLCYVAVTCCINCVVLT
jgi:hypothetical protein